MSDTAVLARPGDRIGNYSVLQQLGSGFFGEVYLAEQPVLGRKVTIKITRRKDESHLKRWYQAATLLGKLDHPNIVRLHDVGEFNGHPYVVMDYIEGRSLAAIAAAGEHIPILVLMRIMAAIAGALQHAHNRQVIHKDVRPQMIIIGPRGHPMLSGFQVAAPSSGDPLLKDGDVVGAPAYIPPEQARGETVSQRSDIWGLGATMYELISGRKPYAAAKDGAPSQSLLSSEPVDLDPLLEKAPDYVATIVGKCLRKDPAERYQSAQELRRAIEAAVDHIEISQGDTVELAAPTPGQTLLLHVEHQEQEIPGAYRQFEVESLLGSGAFSWVYRARELLSGKTVALKVLKREWVANEAAVARFRREAMLLSRISHQNLVRVHNFGRYGSSFFITLDLLEGPTLGGIMAERGPMKVAGALNFVLPVLSAMACVHAAGVVHRDIKPGNIAIVDERVVLFDFGLAYMPDKQKVTLSGSIVGSPAYMAPEQASGQMATSATDVHGAGIILYELLTGHRPYEDEVTYKLLQRIAAEPPTPIGRWNPDLPKVLQATLARMLDKDPARRPGASEAEQILCGLGG